MRKHRSYRGRSLSPRSRPVRRAEGSATRPAQARLGPHLAAACHLPRRALAVLGLALVAATAPLAAQEQPPAAPEESSEQPVQTFAERVEVRVVNVDVVVTDRKGQPVAGLGPEDFELRVEGESLPIAYFYAQTGSPERYISAGSSLETLPEEGRDPSFRPLEDVQATASRRSHVVILVDHSRLTSNNRERAFESVREAVDRLPEEDLVAVVGVENELVFYSDFLFDREAVHRILEQAARVSARPDFSETERRQVFGELARGMSGGILARSHVDPTIVARIQSYAAQEYARGIASLQRIETVVSTLAGLEGRKVLLYVGEGIPTRPGEGLYVEFRNRFAGPERGLPHQDFNTDYTRAIGRYDLTPQMTDLAKSANRAGVTLYAVDAEPDHGGIVKSALTEQGAFSEAISIINENHREPLEFAAKATGGRLLTSSGKLTEQLEEMVAGLGTYYSLGFEAPEDWEAGSEHDIKVDVKGRKLRILHRDEVTLPAPDLEAGATIAALMYQTVDNPLGIGARPGFEVAREDGTAALPVNVDIPIANIGFVPRGDELASSLSLYVSVKDRNGRPGKVQKIPFHLAIPADKMEEAKGESAHYPLPLVIRPGDREVAIGVKDRVNGQFSAVRLDISQYSQF